MDKYYKKWILPFSALALILFLAVIVVPFLTGVLYSFADWRGTYFAGGKNVFESFVGFKNYINAFNNF